MYYVLCLSLLLCSSLVSAAPIADGPLETRQSSTKYLFAFGDSYTATGFSFSGSLPSAGNPIGNPAFPAASSSGGPGWISDLTGTYNRSLTLSYDMAVSGAVVDRTLITPSSSSTVDLVGQSTIFDDNVKDHQHTGAWTADNSLCLMWFGVNDVNQGYNTSDADSLYEKDMSDYFTHAIHIYNSGVKNFAFLSVPPIDRTPLVLSESSSDISKIKSTISLFNSKLEDYVSRFQKSHSVNAHLVSTTDAFNEVLDNPSKYGVQSATCYNSDGTTCPWYNNFHPGVAIQKNVAAAVASSVTTFFHT